MSIETAKAALRDADDAAAHGKLALVQHHISRALCLMSKLDAAPESVKVGEIEVIDHEGEHLRLWRRDGHGHTFGKTGPGKFDLIAVPATE